MRTTIASTHLVSLFLAGLFFLLCDGAIASTRRSDTLLIVTHTTGFRHASIEAGAAALAKMAAEEGMNVEFTADPARFDMPLDQVKVIALVSTTTRRNKPETEWLTGARREALKAFVHRGGGVLAVHGAADAHYGWDWYGKMIGARFSRHPKGTPTGTLRRDPAPHPSLKHLPREFSHVDEWYWFSDFDPKLRPLLWLMPASIGAAQTGPQPVSWAHVFEGGRVFYTALGHTQDAWADPKVLQHVKGGLRWAAGHGTSR